MAVEVPHRAVFLPCGINRFVQHVPVRHEVFINSMRHFRDFQRPVVHRNRGQRQAPDQSHSPPAMLAELRLLRPGRGEDLGIDVIGRAIRVDVRARKSRGNQPRAGVDCANAKFVYVRIPRSLNLLASGRRAKIWRKNKTTVRRIENHRHRKLRRCLREYRIGLNHGRHRAPSRDQSR